MRRPLRIHRGGLVDENQYIRAALNSTKRFCILSEMNDLSRVKEKERRERLAVPGGVNQHVLTPPPKIQRSLPLHTPFTIMTTSLIKRDLAKILANARIVGRRVDDGFVDSLTSELAKLGDDHDGKLNFAYDVLEEYEAILHANHWKTIGYKVGATSDLVQGKLKLREPFFGPLLVPPRRTAATTASNASPSSSLHTVMSTPTSFAEETPVRFSISQDFVRGVEAEFAFRACRDVVPIGSNSSASSLSSSASPHYTAAELTSNYFDVVFPIVEVCGSRLPSSRAAAADGASLIADGAGNHAMVEHPRVQMQRSASSILEHERATVKIDGKIVASGFGEDVLGGPSRSLAWFVDRFVQSGRRKTIPKNAIVSTGAICGLIPISKPCYVTFEFLHWGNIHLAFRE